MRQQTQMEVVNIEHLHILSYVNCLVRAIEKTVIFMENNLHLYVNLYVNAES